MPLKNFLALHGRVFFDPAEAALLPKNDVPKNYEGVYLSKHRALLLLTHAYKHMANLRPKMS